MQFRTNIYLKKIKLSSEAYRRECEMGWSHQTLTSGNESGYFALSVIRWWHMRIHRPFAVSEGMASWIPRLPMGGNRGNDIRTLLNSIMVSLPHMYRSIYGNRGIIFSSVILITVKVGYHWAKPGCQVSGSKFPLYLSTAWVPRYQWGSISNN